MIDPKDARSVLITGCSSGIGRACALHLDAAGWRVFAGLRQPADADALQDEASSALTPLMLDVTDQAMVASAGRAVAEGVGEAGLSALINNAGIVVGGPSEVVPLPDLRRQLEVNVIGQMAVTQAVLPLLRRARGRIVNISSISGRVALPMMGPYAASKFALEAFSDSLRVELGMSGIDVVLIEPGSIATPIWEKTRDAAMQMLDSLPEGALDPYRDVFERMQPHMANAGKNARPVELVVDAVVHALTASRPKTRYMIGRSSRILLLLHRILPTRVFDRLVMRKMGMR